MVDPDRTPLEGAVEIDESSIPYRKKEERSTGGQGRGPQGQMFIIAAVERRSGRKAGRIRLARLAENNAENIRPFVLANTAPGSTICTDGNQSYRDLGDRTHVARNLSAKNELPAHVVMERSHRVVSNLKTWGKSVFHGFRTQHLDAYLNEFAFSAGTTARAGRIAPARAGGEDGDSTGANGTSNSHYLVTSQLLQEFPGYAERIMRSRAEYGTGMVMEAILSRDVRAVAGVVRLLAGDPANASRSLARLPPTIGWRIRRSLFYPPRVRGAQYAHGFRAHRYDMR